MRRRFRKLNNRGSSIVVVVIAMAMIGVLATSILWMSYMNYRIKVNDIRNKESFYTAETVVEQIMAGVQGEASKAAAEAYQEVLRRWDELDQESKESTESSRYQLFAATYLETLYAELTGKNDAETPPAGHYNRSVLQGYVDRELFNEEENKGTGYVDKAEWDSSPAEIERIGNSSIILRNIRVKYMDIQNDRVSIVNTDIQIDVPKLAFSQSGTIDELYHYVMIADKGLEADSLDGTVHVKGSIYAGTGEDGKGGIIVGSEDKTKAAKVVVEETQKIVTAGDIRINGNGSAFSVQGSAEHRCSVFAQNLRLEGGNLKLDGKIYVANDLLLNGTGSKAIISGEYYGYGALKGNGTEEEETDTSASSAILINGRNSTIDLTGVDRLLLAGRACIGVEEQGKGSPVMMGESIAVKGGQIAYLVPAECIGVGAEGIEIGQNPVSGEQAGRMLDRMDEASAEYDENFQEVDFTKPVYKLGGKSLSDFGVTSMEQIRRVSVQDHNDTRNYYYLVLSPEQAEKYFAEYYQTPGNKETIDNYFDRYASGGIRLGDTDSGEYTILGNSLISDALSGRGSRLLTRVDEVGQSGVEGEETTEAETAEVVKTISVDIAAQYRQLCCNLTESGNSFDEDGTVFANVIRKEELEDYLKAHHAKKILFTSVSDSGLQACVAKEDITLSELGSKVCLIITTGNVTVDKDFDGLILAGGKIVIENGAAAISDNKMELADVLSATTGAEKETVTPLAFFRQGGGSLLEGAREAYTDENGNLVLDYSELVYYVNWKKK